MRCLLAFVFVSCVVPQIAQAQKIKPFGWRTEFPEPPILLKHRILDFLNPGFRSLDVDPRTPEPQVAVYRQAAVTLAKANLAPPAERVGHFAWLMGHDFRGWDGFVTNVEPTPEGLIVTVRISAHLYMMISTDSVTERYCIARGQVRWLDGDFKEGPYQRDLLGF